MPTADQHRKKFERNRQYLNTIDIDAAPEWAATVAFYAALHAVERLRRAVGDGNSAGHAGRLNYLEHRHPAIHTAFVQLYDASMLARYESVGEFFGSYTVESVRDDLVGRFLPQIEQYVERVLAPPAGGSS